MSRPLFPRQVQLGATGPDVLAYKRALIRWNDGHPNGVVVNDVLGAAAVKLLKHFQQVDGLTADGVLGSASFSKMVGLDLFDAYGVSLLEAAQKMFLYRNPFRDVPNLAFAGYDQGVDFSGGGPVYAIGPAVVNVATERSGWPGGGAVAYTFTDGPAKGLTWYLAENLTVLVRAGDAVASGTKVAVMHDAYPYTESGWAQHGTDSPMSQPISHAPTFFGVNGGDLLISLGERRCQKGFGGSDTPLPSGWPRWL